jgi:hypothetical protein
MHAMQLFNLQSSLKSLLLSGRYSNHVVIIINQDQRDISRSLPTTVEPNIGKILPSHLFIDNVTNTLFPLNPSPHTMDIDVVTHVTYEPLSTFYRGLNPCVLKAREIRGMLEMLKRGHHKSSRCDTDTSPTYL